MKKFFLTMCVALLSMSIQAQEQKHEVGVFYGAGSGNQIDDEDDVW
jgi:hypothetical protein